MIPSSGQTEETLKKWRKTERKEKASHIILLWRKNIPDTGYRNEIQGRAQRPVLPEWRGLERGWRGTRSGRRWGQIAQSPAGHSEDFVFHSK